MDLCARLKKLHRRLLWSPSKRTFRMPSRSNRKTRRSSDLIKVAVIWNPNNVAVNGFMRTIKEAAPSIAVEPIEAHVQNAVEIKSEDTTLFRSHQGGSDLEPE